MSAVHTPGPRQSFLALLIVPVIVAYAALSAFPARRAAEALQYPFQLDNVEGYLLDEAMQLARGRTIYAPIDQPPYLVGNYPPVYQLCYALLVKASGPSLAWGRMLSLISLVVIGGFMILLVAAAGRQLAPAFLAPLLFIATFECHNWAAYARVDLMAIALSLGGLLAFGSGRSRRRMAGAVVLFALAALTKQTALAAPAACAIFLLGRGLAPAFQFAASFALLLGAISALLHAVTGGQYLLHTIAYNVNAMNWDDVRRVWLPHLDRFYHYQLIGIVLAVGFVSYRLIRPFAAPPTVGALPAAEETSAEAKGPDAAAQEEKEPDIVQAKDQASEEGWGTDSRARLGLLTLYFILCLPSIPALAKVGSAENYLLEPLAAGALLLCAALGRTFWESAHAPGAWSARFFGVAISAALLAQCWWIFRGDLGAGAPLRPVQAMFARGTPDEAQRQRARSLYFTIASEDGRVLSEDPIFQLLSGRRPAINPFILSQLAREGKWDEGAFVREIEEGRFDLVVATADFRGDGPFARWTDAMAGAMRRNYRMEQEVNLGPDGQTYFLYRPLPRERRESWTVAGRRVAGWAEAAVHDERRPGGPPFGYLRGVDEGYSPRPRSLMSPLAVRVIWPAEMVPLLGS